MHLISLLLRIITIDEKKILNIFKDGGFASQFHY
jgi:hypothetical protein